MILLASWQGLGFQGCTPTDLCRAGWKSAWGLPAREVSHIPAPTPTPVVCVGDRKSPTAPAPAFGHPAPAVVPAETAAADPALGL